jgi:hypothetical protein
MENVQHSKAAYLNHFNQKIKYTCWTPYLGILLEVGGRLLGKKYHITLHCSFISTLMADFSL